MKLRTLIFATLTVAAWLCMLGLCLSQTPPAPVPAPSLVPPAVSMIVGVQYPIDLQNCPTALQSKSVLTVHPKTGATFFPVSWGTRQQVLFQATVPGTYSVSLYWPDANGTVQETEVSVVVSGVTPVNPPDPGPAPPTSGTIANGKLWLIGVLPSLTAQTPTQAAIESSAAVQAAIAKHGNHFRWIDPQTAPPDLEPYVQEADVQTGSAGVLLVADGSNPASIAVSKRLKATIPITATVTPATVVSLIQKWGGK